MLVSQWKVNSTSTSQFMEDFYRALESNHRSRGVTKSYSGSTSGFAVDA